MATPQLTKTTIPGQLGEIFIDIRTSQRAPAPTVLVGHGFKGFKDWGMFPPFAERLARAGFTAVTFNVSGSGYNDRGEVEFPDRFGHNTFSTELADLEAILAQLERGALGVPPPTSIGIVGHSRGGGMATLLASRQPQIRVLVTWAAIATVHRWPSDQRAAWRATGRLDVVNTRTGQVLPLFSDILDDLDSNADSKLSIEAAARRIVAPWLILHGAADETVPIEEAHRLAKWASGARLVEIPDAGHTFGAAHPLEGPAPLLEQVFTESVGFLSAHLT